MTDGHEYRTGIQSPSLTGCRITNINAAHVLGSRGRGQLQAANGNGRGGGLCCRGASVDGGNHGIGQQGQLGIRLCAVHHDLGGAERITTMNQRD